MFARSVSIRLKPNSAGQLAQIIEQDVLPVLQKQKGFQDEITLVAPGGADALAISLWEKKENADAYGRDAYPGLLKTIAKVVDGNPHVQTYEVTSSTFHKITAHATARS
jgi:hypothetical protein